ncbi:prepilin peptidase [Lyticum sinuosum]|uniref:Prepilin peptidase n=1 Tax=Lyticum sinuosum TaxID=1332059 RepID=A0AAE4VL14_9RICK|nr:prepilin peptidase [Lyticum sinuosum]MDZ5761630.1 Prepilin peptidase [Lyticum sinuosum]
MLSFIYIFLLFIGLIIGNLLTTLIYRIPRNLNFDGGVNLESKPFCGFCHHPLKFYEYLPLLSWIFVGRKCNYCKSEIPIIYTYIEIIAAISLPLNYAIKCSNGFTEANCQDALISSLYCFAIILNIAIYLESQKIYYNIIITLIFLRLINQILNGNSFSDFFIRILYTIVIILSFCKNYKNDIPTFISIGTISATYGNKFDFVIIFMIFYTLMYFFEKKYKIYSKKYLSNVNIIYSYPICLFLLCIISYF